MPLTYKRPTVRGEHVEIVRVDESPMLGVLGATVPGASILVRYPTGEQGYVRKSDIVDIAAQLTAE